MLSPWRRRGQVAAIGLVALAVVLVALGPIAIAVRETTSGATLPGDDVGRFLDVDGHRVHVVEAGAGPPLVLVHGFGGSTYDYEEHVLARLARSHRVIAVDLYGFGWSERSPGFRYGWSLWTEQLVHTLDVLGIERASFAGHSMGGGAVAVLTARHPDRVDHLVLGDALYPLEDGEIALPFRAMALRVVGELALGLVGDLSAPGSSAENRRRAAGPYAIAGTRAAWLGYVRDSTRRADLAAAYAQLSTLPTRVLVLHGTSDTFVPYPAMERTTRAMSNVELVRLEGGGHFPHRDDPERYVHEVEAFLARP